MLLCKLFRTAWKYKAQFVSMIIMVAIGTGVFIGFNMEWYSLEVDTSNFFEQTHYADYRIINEQGFNDEDIQAIKNIKGVEAASRVLNVNVDVKDEKKTLALFALEEYIVSTMLVTSGKDYDKELDGFWLSDQYAATNNVKLGDTLTVIYRGVEISGEVVGLVKSGEFMICTSGANQLMPDYTTYGFVYVSPEKVKSAFHGLIFYPQINVLSDLEKPQMEMAVKDVIGKTMLVLGKEEHIAYAGVQSEVKEGKTMVSVLPILFLLIGVLTMITTMHRVTANEKTQIGILKALGFKNRRVSAHYTSYGLFIGIVGCIFGVALGFGICAFIINPAGMMSTYMDLPDWGLHAPWWTWFVLIGVVGFLTFISFLSVKKMLKGTAADVLRPYTPKKVKPLAIEKIRAWDKVKFATKWNLRDVFRHKTRSIMTLVGIIGCMVLLVGGLGMKDSMTGFLNTLGHQVLNYETRVNFSEMVTNEQVIEFTNKYDGDYVAATSVQVKGEPITLEVYNVSHNCVNFIDKNNRTVALKSDGAYISLRVADRGYKVGDTIEFSPYGSEMTYSVKVVGLLRSMLSESIMMTTDFAETIELPYAITSAFVNKAETDIERTELVAGMQNKSDVMHSYNSFMEVMNTMVLVLVLAAIVLGIVVLYNLGVMSYMERSRELATIKVIGFKNRHIGRILIGQNIWLTIIGIIIGLATGIGTLYLLIKLLASEYELKMMLSTLTYFVSILLTFGVSIVVSIFVARKNKKINMVEALKGVD